MGRRSIQKLGEILELKTGMNSTRNFTVESAYQEIKVTPFWLLGFIEAEGSFSVTKSTIQQTFFLTGGRSNFL